MKFGVLGPVHIADAAGRPCTPHASKLRVLLATLLVRYGRVVSTQYLMNELWAGKQPKTARTAMQVYVSGLRKLFQEASLSQGVVSIVTRPPGYMLEVDEREFDLPCFEEEMKAARQAEDLGELEAAAYFISDALALWRGPALYGMCDTAGLQTEARRLNELRMAAFERRILIDLKRGRESELIGELYAVTSEYPLRERLWEYLILALHNQGRPADALHAYDMIRLQMRDELGLEPGASLRQLQQVVLSRGEVTVNQDGPFSYAADSGLPAMQRFPRWGLPGHDHRHDPAPGPQAQAGRHLITLPATSRVIFRQAPSGNTVNHKL
jgi:SARP family transcriptional regulator, regulator of embCAB operon